MSIEIVDDTYCEEEPIESDDNYHVEDREDLIDRVDRYIYALWDTVKNDDYMRYINFSDFYSFVLDSPVVAAINNMK